MTYNNIAEPAKLFRMMFLIAFILYRIVIAYLLVYYNITFINVIITFRVIITFIMLLLHLSTLHPHRPHSSFSSLLFFYSFSVSPPRRRGCHRRPRRHH